MLTIEEIYQEHSQTVYRYLLSLSHDESVAEELTQETFYQAVKSVQRYDGSSNIVTWLCAIAKHSYYSYQRKHPVIDQLNEDMPSQATTEKSILARESSLEILKGMQRLSPEVREVVYLRIFGELSFREIGDILSKTENWARVTYYRGKEKLKKELIDNEK